MSRVSQAGREKVGIEFLYGKDPVNQEVQETMSCPLFSHRLINCPIMKFIVP